MESISNIINRVKDGYLHVIGWVAAHPHKSFWGALAAFSVAVVF